MLKKIILSLIFLFVQVCYAESCPSLSQIKQNNLHGWQAFNLDSGEPLSAKEFQKIKNHIKKFESAQWLEDAPEGAGQCYYEQNQENLEVYFAKATLPPVESDTNWHKVSWGYLKCEISVVGCRFRDGRGGIKINTTHHARNLIQEIF